MLHYNFLKELPQIGQFFRRDIYNLVFGVLFGDGVENVDQEQDLVFDELELEAVFGGGVENGEHELVDVLYLFNEEVDKSFLGLGVADVEGGGGVGGQEPGDEEDAVADAGGLDPELFFLLDGEVLLVEGDAVLEDAHAVVEDHVLDGLLVDLGDIGFYQCYFIAVDLLYFHVVVFYRGVQAVQVHLRQLQHETVGNHFAQYQLVVAVEEEEGEEVEDA